MVTRRFEPEPAQLLEPGLRPLAHAGGAEEHERRLLLVRRADEAEPAQRTAYNREGPCQRLGEGRRQGALEGRLSRLSR